MMNPQFQHYLNLSKSFLVLRKFQECRQYAIRAREIDPNHSEVLEIIAITDILMLPESINGQPNYYAILNVPNYSDDQQVMLNNFKSLMKFSSDPSDKVRFDDELRNAVNDGRSVSMNPMGGEDGLESASFFDLTMMTRFGDGLETGGNSLNQRQMDRSNDGLLESMLNLTRSNDGLLESMLNPTRLNDGLLESMLNPTRLNDGLLQSILNSSGMTVWMMVMGGLLTRLRSRPVWMMGLGALLTRLRSRPVWRIFQTRPG
ncbi:hypothetical protein P3S67_026826 [Capsicum chacoense]